jgi:tetratricopeptide (TPR) repeat protein
MNGIVKNIIVMGVVFSLCATAGTSVFAVDLPKKVSKKNQDRPIRHVILPPEKKPYKPPPQKRAPKSEYNLSPYMTGGDEAVLREALNAYRAGNLTGAIAEAKRLLTGEGDAPEVAGYFIAEFYLKQADEGGDKEAAGNALTALQKAVVDYPQSDRLLYGQFRMGEVYIRQKFFHEAIGNFTRIIDRGFEDEFTLKAKIGIAKTYQAWGRWPEAKRIFTEILQGKKQMPPKERSAVLFGHADILYQMGQFESAYQGYKIATEEEPWYRALDPTALFQFGEAAYRSHHLDDSKKAFFNFYNIYPKHPLSPVALARIKTMLNAEKKQASLPKKDITLISPKISSMDDTLKHLAYEAIRVSNKDPLSNLGRILLALETIQRCLQKIPQKTTEAEGRLACDRPSLGEQAFYKPSKLRSGLREGIKVDALDLINAGAPSTTSQGILLEAIYHLKKYKDIESVIAIEASLLVNLPNASPYRKEIEDTLHQTIVSELGMIHDPEKIVTLYYSYPVAFTKQMLQSEIGYTIAMSHINTGLLTKGMALLEPVSENLKEPLWKEAVYEIGKASVAIGEYGEAQQALEKYQRISADKNKAFADLGHLHFKRGDAGNAVLAYQQWLSHFPKHADRPDIYLKLSEAYRYQNDFENEIKVYSRWIAEEKGKGLDLPLMRHADTHFQLAQYDKAIASYRAIVENNTGGAKEMDWAMLRLATSYDLAGQAKEGKKYLEDISRRKKNSLIKQIAVEKTNAH